MFAKPPQPPNAQPAEQPKGLFDLGDAQGVNESERILTKLCQRSFLRLWSQTNVFTDEGFKDGKGATKELTDALVIFGNDVIVFSDKHVRFQDDRPLDVAWPRWYRRAVLESCKQLHGAKSWLSRFPERAFLDAKCTRMLPITMPTGPEVRFHLVAVTRGSRDAAIKNADGHGLGSFGVNTFIVGDDHLRAPFVIGLPEPKKAFVHVFDEVSIELVMQELDTAVDFLGYLKAREDLLGHPGRHVIAPGEEDLVASFLSTTDRTGTKHVFFDLDPEDGQPDMVMYDGSHYAGLRKDPGYLRKKQADRISYEWDRLIDRFIDYGDPGLRAELGLQSQAETETGLRLLAAESRYTRRQLAQTLQGALLRVEPGQRLARIFNSQVAGETVFIFLVMPLRREASYSEYRQNRLATLHAYVQTARLQAPLATTFVGIAFDNPHKDYEGSAEDMFVLRKDLWTEAELADLELKQEQFGFWKARRVERSRHRQDEFPQASQSVPIERIFPHQVKPPRSAKPDGRRQSEKRRKKAQQASQRANRKKR